MNYLRFKDLKARGIVENWTTLQRWIHDGLFPRGVLLGPRIRAWTAEEIEKHLVARPVDRPENMRRRPYTRRPRKPVDVTGTSIRVA